ncbi:outer membrane protein assembly factor BamA [Ramlibacter sp. AW1]|uniref:Outer membrane protein assembly factor BamA n=1 Tax=Ramlibacter aurantiacus TaxID=2801330 RepID=A0A936ZTK6_9BURK|nr:outer membrane protein assembly factor BamA [Ramlibacter aurantiacus]MBL0420374.1 outer membrane protein assembly factor BamA [Ramlibacter aurantiacus]
MKKYFKRFRARTWAGVMALTLAAQVWAIDPFTVRDIRVEGLQRVEPGTVFASLPFRVGDQYTDDKGTAAIRALFGLGLFKDVRLEVSGDVLVVVVEERPTVAQVDFVGTREFPKDVLTKALRDIGLAEGRAFDQALADRAEQELKRQYISRGLYGAEVVTTVTPLERNRVNLTFSVTEGEPARIREIRVVGNQTFPDSTLLGLMELDTGGILSWYTKSDRYSRAKLNASLEALRSYYLQRGFLEFRIDSTQVALTPDRREISITVNVTEGERFVVSGVRLEGNFLGREDEFKSLITIQPGEPYNADQVAATTKAISDYFGNFGYAFAQVEARPDIDRSTNRVQLVLAAEPQRRVYVRRINIAGNVRTRDEVIRREFRQLESSWYDIERIRRSRDRVDRLGFFRDVNIETAEVPGAPDQVDLVVEVTEKPTGSLQLSAGFSSAEKLALGFAVRQENAFGSGNYLSLDVNTSKYNRTLSLTTVDPYFTIDGISRRLEAYYRKSRPYEEQGGNYSLATMGGAVRLGVPFSEEDTVFFGIGVESTEIQPGTNIPAAYLAYAERFGFRSTAIPLTLAWSRDDRDSALVPTRGRLQRLSGELGPFADARYWRANYQITQFVPFTRQYTLGLNGEIGWGDGLGGRDFPVFKNFYAGGLGSVRGFTQGTLGPRDITGATLGGAKKIVLNAEVSAPFPGAGNDRTLRMFAFGDVGNVFGQDQTPSLSDLRTSVGVGVAWISPLGPLRLVFAQPVRKEPGDRIQRIQFQIGTSF